MEKPALVRIEDDLYDAYTILSYTRILIVRDQDNRNAESIKAIDTAKRLIHKANRLIQQN